MRPRECGECTACCTVMTVTDQAMGFHKPGHTACEKLIPAGQLLGGRSSGCSTYDNRPKPCCEFECLWLQENRNPKDFQLMRNMERPDRVGVVLDITGPGSAFSKATGIQFMLVAHPVDLDAPFSRSMDLLQRLSRRTLVALVYPDGKRKLLGPEKQIEIAKKWIDRAA